MEPLRHGEVVVDELEKLGKWHWKIILQENKIRKPLEATKIPERDLI